MGWKLLKKKKSKGHCALPNCWEDAQVAGMCGACYSWWRNIQLKTASELGLYLKRISRFAGRAGTMSANSRGVVFDKRIMPGSRKHG